MRALILDVETTGTDPAKDQVVEIAMVSWSTEHGMIWVESELVYGTENAAVAVNRIQPEALQLARLLPVGIPTRVAHAALDHACILAHNAEFDRSFAGGGTITNEDGVDEPPATWVCTMDDVRWPEPVVSGSLINMALSMGVGVLGAHRALDDCLTLVRMLERLPDPTVTLMAAIMRALVPKLLVRAETPFHRNEEIKAHGFKFDGDLRRWFRRMPVDEAAALPFPTSLPDGTRLAGVRRPMPEPRDD